MFAYSHLSESAVRTESIFNSLNQIFFCLFDIFFDYTAFTFYHQFHDSVSLAMILFRATVAECAYFMTTRGADGLFFILPASTIDTTESNVAVRNIRLYD